MRQKFLLTVTTLLWMAISLLAIDLNIDVVTNLNNPSALLIENDTLFAATDGGLLVYNQTSGNYQTHTSADGFFSQQFSAVNKTHRGKLVLGSLDGVISFLDLKDGSIQNDLSLKGNPIWDIISLQDTLWVLTSDLIAVYVYFSDQERYQFIDFFDNFGVADPDFKVLYYFGEKIWAGGSKGILLAPSNFTKVNLKASSNWERISTNTNFPATVIYDMLKYDRTLFLGTNRGVVYFDSLSGQWKTITSGLESSRIYYLKSRANKLYAADYNRVYEFDNTRKSFQKIWGSNIVKINDLAINDAGDIWVALEDRGLRNLTNGTRVWVDGPLDNYIGEVYLDSKGRLWATSGSIKDERKKGIFVRTGEGWKNYRFFGTGTWKNLSSSLKIMEDRAGYIWISSWGGGVAVFDEQENFEVISRPSYSGNVWISSPVEDDTLQVQIKPTFQNKLYGTVINSNYVVVTGMMVDPFRNMIWLLNLASLINRPLVLLKTDRFSADIENDDLWQYVEIPFGGTFGDNIYGITIDAFGDIWIASERSGVYRIRIKEDGTFSWGLITEQQNLKTNWIRAIAADPDGFIWIGTRSGLNAYLNGDVFDFREDFQPIGLQINDIFIDSRNNKWFATDKGLSILKSSGSPWEKKSWIHLVPQSSELFGDNIIHVNLPAEKIHSVFLDENSGDVYLGTAAGLAIIRNNPFASAFENFDQLETGPNPFRIGDGKNQFFYLYNLMPGTEVKILSVNGQLIRVLEPNNISENTGAAAIWDGKNEAGELVSTGVYLYLLTTEEGKSRAGKVLVIREK